MKLKHVTALIAVMVTLAMLAACGTAPPAAPADTPTEAPAATDAPEATVSSAAAPATEGDTLRIITPFLSRPLDPAAGGSFAAVSLNIGETLMRLDEHFTPVPWLAADLQPIEPRTWEITLRENAVFHDGTPVDAAAVKASLERAVEQIATAQTLLNLERIDVVNETTLTLTTREPNPRMPGLLTEPSTVIVSAAAAEAMGDEAFAQQPVLTGIYKVEAFQQDRELIAVRHAEHWNEPASSERLIVSVQSDADARMLALQSGQVDIAVDIRPESVQVAERDPDLRVVSAAPAATMFMYINHGKEPWSDLRVRQALAHAFPPRETLIQTVLRGEGVPSVGPFPTPVLECPGLEGYAHDLEQARSLLAEAGLEDSNGDGVIEFNDEPLEILVLSYPQRPALTPMAEIIQANLADIGIAMQIRSVEQINDALANQEWDGGMYFNNMAATGDPFGSLSNFYTSEGSANRSNYRNADIEQQIMAMQPLTDRTERLEQACDISQRLIDDVAIIPLVYPNYNFGVSANVRGFETTHPYFLYFVTAAMSRSS
jgi:peptide/nickel transport system substrate-binding protein